MYRNHKISLYIPCRNEEKNLETLRSRIPDFVDEVLIISNKSTDRTYSKARKLGFKAYKDDRTSGGIGYGYAHMTGIQKSKGDIIISVDGDAEHPIEELNTIIDCFIDNNMDFVYCNRYPLPEGTKTSFKQWLGVNILNWETRFLYGVKVKDILSGMWLIRKDIKFKLNLTEGDWNLSPQIKLNAITTPGIKCGEYSIAQNNRTEGETKQEYFKTGVSHMYWIFKNRFGLNRELVLDTDMKAQKESKLYFNLK